MTASKMWIVVFVLLSNRAWATDPVIGLEKSKVWSKPQVLSKTVGEVTYGTKVKVLAKKGGWLQIQAPGVSGWVMKSAIESRGEFTEAIGSGKTQDGKYGSQDVAAAGKGWDPNVEKSHREKNPSLDYTSVDAMEKINFTADQFVPGVRSPASTFQKTGKLQSKIYGSVK